MSAGVPVRAHAAAPPLFTPAGRTTRPLCVWVGDRQRERGRKKFGTMFTFFGCLEALCMDVARIFKLMWKKVLGKTNKSINK